MILGECGERQFDQSFSVWPWNEHSWIDVESYGPEFSITKNVMNGFIGCSTLHERANGAQLVRFEWFMVLEI